MTTRPPALSAGFTRVSYANNAASLFTFTPPAGATVQHKSLPSSAHAAGGAMVTPTGSGHALTLTQAQAKAQIYGLNLLSATHVHFAALQRRGGAAGGRRHGATAILHYGSGFGSVVLVESNAAAGPSSGLQQQLSALPRGLVATTSVGGAQAYELSTSLIDVIGWQHSGVTLVAAGMVPSTTLHQLAVGVH